jgi:hypothetical protein
MQLAIDELSYTISYIITRFSFHLSSKTVNPTPSMNPTLYLEDGMYLIAEKLNK